MTTRIVLIDPARQENRIQYRVGQSVGETADYIARCLKDQMPFATEGPKALIIPWQILASRLIVVEEEEEEE